MLPELEKTIGIRPKDKFKMAGGVDLTLQNSPTRENIA
jgi:hypothetical protein